MSKTENHKYYLDECFHRFGLPKPLQQDSKIVHKSVKNLSTQYAWKVIAKICVLPPIMKPKCTPKSFQFWDLWSRFPDSGSQHGSKIDFEAPKSLPRAPKRPPRAAKRHLGALKKLPRRCQEAQLRPQNNSKTYFETLLEQNKYICEQCTALRANSRQFAVHCHQFTRLFTETINKQVSDLIDRTIEHYQCWA